jgi:hypothetical protein
MPKDRPRLDGGLIARKGEATPALAATSVTPSPGIKAPPIDVPTQNERSMPRGLAGTIAVTVRLDPARYEHLKVYGVRKRLTNQDIIVAALDAYLPMSGKTAAD